MSLSHSFLRVIRPISFRVTEFRCLLCSCSCSVTLSSVSDNVALCIGCSLSIDRAEIMRNRKLDGDLSIGMVSDTHHGDKEPLSSRTGLRGDYCNICLLLLLYVLQVTPHPVSTITSDKYIVLRMFLTNFVYLLRAAIHCLK